ncbi:MAG: DNA-binding response regulator, LuxR family [Verrucomicrobia bacterium]|nr:DNA-binding response regulator, LuxR family [Verrucomicrobiota bacterium]
MTEAHRQVAIVDDDPRMRRELELTLLRHGYHPVLFASAEEFLELGLATEFDCMLLDLRMPGVSGMELLQRLRPRQRSYPIIVLTSEKDVGVEDEALLTGASAFLAKGTSNPVLLSAIERAIN